MLAVVFGSLAFLTKYTNILALVGVLVLVVAREFLSVRKTNTSYSLKRILVIGWPLILIVLFMVFNLVRFGLSDPLGSLAVAHLFKENTIQVGRLH